MFSNDKDLSLPMSSIVPYKRVDNVSVDSRYLSTDKLLFCNDDFSRMTAATSPICMKAVLLAEYECQRDIKEVTKNDSVRIAQYKMGVHNSAPWCGSFVSWLYGEGQGSSNDKTFGYNASTQEIKRKAEAAGCYATKNSGYTPRVGDLAMWSKTQWTGHVGIVTKVYKDGSFDVVEGNSNNNKVEKIHYKSQNDVGSSFNGFVKMNEWMNGNFWTS